MTVTRVPLRRLARILNGGTPPSGAAGLWDGEVPFATPPDLNGLDGMVLKSTARTITVDGTAYSGVAPAGSVLLSTRAPIGHIGRLNSPVAFNQGCRALVPGGDIDARFLAYALVAARSDLDARGLGTTFLELSGASLAQVKVPLVPLHAQREIADYLDGETAQIDAFVAKNEELIALLAERRAGVIARAVLRGLDADVELRTSGVERLGEVPGHWSVQRLASTVARARNGVWGADPDGGEEDLRCVRVADFDRRCQRIHDNAHTMRKLTAAERVGRVLRYGDLLLEKSGGGEKSPVGFVVLYDRDDPAVCSNFVARVQLRSDMDPAFWTYVHGVMYRLRITEKSLKQSTGIQNLDQGAYFNEYVAVPPYREQVTIARYLESKVAEIDGALEKAHRGVSLARERRVALISAAVSGKVDVGGNL